ncbi:SNARE-binding exocyst subunit S6 [Conglomerata obtusa]
MDEAHTKLHDLLNTPSSLDNLSALIIETRKSLHKDRHAYKDHLLQNLYNLNQNHSTIFNIKSDKKGYERLFTTNQALLQSFDNYIPDYDKIEQVSLSYRNFRKVHDLNEKLVNLDREIAEISENNTSFETETFVTNNITSLHHKIFTFEEFKYELIFYAKSIDRESFLNVQRKVNLVYRVCAGFKLCFLKVGNNFLKYFQDVNVHKAVVYVLCLEEERDEMTKKVKGGGEKDDLMIKEICRVNYRYKDRDENNYKKQFECAMKDLMIGRVGKLRQGDFNVGRLEFVFDDLNYIKIYADNELNFEKIKVKNETLKENKKQENKKNSLDIKGSDSNSYNTDKSDTDESLEDTNSKQSNDKYQKNNSTNNFNDNEEANVSQDESSEKFNLRSFEVLIIDWKNLIITFHAEIKKFLDEKLFNSGDILYVLDFIERFYSYLSSNFKLQKENLGDDLLGEKEDIYISDYIKSATSSLGAWIQTLTNNELELFYERDVSPVLDEEDKYISNNFINFLQLIKQQLEPISFNKKIFKMIAKEINKFAKIFSKEMIKAMEKDFLPCCKQKGNPGYEEYVIMMGNSGLKVTQYISSLPQSQSEEVKELGNTFISITKKSNFFLASFVLYTCKPITDKIFTDEWYNEELIRTITVTIDDFLVDYRLTMSDFSFITFIYELTSELTKVYLKQLIRKRAKIYEDCGYKLEKDYDKIYETFCKYGEQEEVKSNLEAFKKLIPLLERCSMDIFIIELKSLLVVYPDIKREYIKSIIYKKNELSESEKRKYLNRIKECFNDIKNVRKTLFSTLF